MSKSRKLGIMPMLWKWLCTEKRYLVVYVAIILTGGPLVAIGVLDHFPESVLAGIVASIAPLFEIRMEWLHFCWQQEKLKHNRRRNEILTKRNIADSTTARDSSPVGDIPEFTFDLNHGPSIISILLVVILLPIILYQLKRYIAAIALIMDISVLAVVLSAVFAAYFGNRCSMKKLHSR